MAQYMAYPFFIKFLAKKYLWKRYDPAEARDRWRSALVIYRRFVEEAPDIGGKENNMSGNLYMALAVFALYEATGRSITAEELTELMENALPKRIPLVGAVLDMNKPKVQEKMRTRYVKYKALSDARLDSGAWGNSWRVELNPHGREKGVAFDFLCCPLADFARRHGYDEIMPILCRFDYATATLMRAKLLREHTISAGGPCCDFWYLGDKEA